MSTVELKQELPNRPKPTIDVLQKYNFPKGERPDDCRRGGRCFFGRTHTLKQAREMLKQR